ncbi:hydroxyethylthiazole kinase [Erwinia sp. CPCC 100877]|nr:hydroxyethylthiazole kinase [Erwinia sp. CPCC 100877]
MKAYELIETIRIENPLVHNITNIVVANDSANGLLAIGASPFMSSTLAEMEEVAALANVVVLNMGTLNDEQLRAMIIAGKKANELNKPVVVDPVGAGATSYRRQAVKQLLSEVKPTLIRGNAGEIAALAGVTWAAKGVDAGSGTGDVQKIAKQLALKTQTLIAVSGETDIITNGQRTYLVHNGTSYFTKMTGAGCLHGCICGAFLAVAEENLLESVVAASTMYALAGELVAEQLNGLAVGSFRTYLLDQLSQINETIVRQRAKIERVDEDE